MKRAKRVLTLMLAIVMMFSMTIIASAADTTKSAVITVTDAGEQATFTYAKVIQADATTRTGWSIVSGYEAIFADFGNDAQSRIEGYIAANESTRIAKIKAANVSINTPFNNPLTVNEPGLYIIYGTEEGYDYNPMLAYVGFNGKTGEQAALVDATLKAKRTPNKVDKTIDETKDKFVAIGDEVTYTVKATVPYAPEGATTTLVINDELTGGTFKLNSSDKTVVTVSLGNQPTLEITPVNNKLTIDLSYLIKADNEHANKQVVITYVAIVTGELVNNKATINNNPTEAVVTSYTGNLKITKMNEAGSTSPEALAGAGFVVVNADGKFATLENGVLTGWVDTADAATTITTGPDGTATVAGFDANKTYKFHEVVAPPGYKVNSEDVTAVWKAGQADNAQIAEATMHDTKLSSLPYTGGKGTAAFTGFGVLLMSIGAGLFFANKKDKSVK